MKLHITPIDHACRLRFQQTLSVRVVIVSTPATRALGRIVLVTLAGHASRDSARETARDATATRDATVCGGPASHDAPASRRSSAQNLSSGSSYLNGFVASAWVGTGIRGKVFALFAASSSMPASTVDIWRMSSALR